MNSDILKQIGIDPFYIIAGLLGLIVILFIIMIVAMVNQKKLRKKYEAFMNGKNAESLEETMVRRFEDIDRLIVLSKKHRKEIDYIKSCVNNTYQKVGIVRYDAFREMGGKLSFAICLLDNFNNGFVLNAMHSSEGCFTYMKEIVHGTTEVILSAEEKGAVEEAVSYVPTDQA